MARRRMISTEFIKTNQFMNLTVRQRYLYVILIANADDDGFVESLKMALYQAGATKQDLSRLIAEGLLLVFEPNLVVITHWKIHNLIPKDRYHKSIHYKELEQLTVENGVYKMYTDCIQNRNILYTESSLGKSSLGKSNIYTFPKNQITENDYEETL